MKTVPCVWVVEIQNGKDCWLPYGVYGHHAYPTKLKATDTMKHGLPADGRLRVRKYIRSGE